MTRAVAVEIGTYTVKAAVLDNDGPDGKIEIVKIYKKYFCSTAQKRERLKDILRDVGPCGRFAVMFAGNNTLCRYSKPVKSLPKVIEYTENDLIANIRADLEKSEREIYYYDHFLQNTTDPGKVVVGLSAVLNEEAFEVLQEDLKECGIINRSTVNMDTLAHYNLFTSVVSPDEEDNLAIIDINSERIIVSILKAGRTLCYFRTIPTLDNGIDGTIDNVCITLISTTAWSALESYLRITKVYVSGSDKNFDYIEKHLQKNEVQAVRINLQESPLFTSREAHRELNEFGICIGLGLGSLNNLDSSVNLLRQYHDIRRKKILQAAAAGVVMMLIWGSTLSLYSTIPSARKDGGNLQTRLSEKLAELARLKKSLDSMEFDIEQTTLLVKTITWYLEPLRQFTLKEYTRTEINGQIPDHSPLMMDLLDHLSRKDLQLSRVSFGPRLLTYETVSKETGAFLYVHDQK